MPEKEMRNKFGDLIRDKGSSSKNTSEKSAEEKNSKLSDKGKSKS